MYKGFIYTIHILGRVKVWLPFYKVGEVKVENSKVLLKVERGLQKAGYATHTTWELAKEKHA